VEKSLERIKFTKAKTEISCMIDEWREAQINAGVPKLKRYQTDDVAGDRGLMHSTFPELDEGTVPYQPNRDVPTATIKQDNLCYITTVDGANNYIKGAIDILRQHTSDGDVYCWHT
jgi:hypothetical protein